MLPRIRKTLRRPSVRKKIYRVWTATGPLLIAAGAVTDQQWSLYTGVASAVGSLAVSVLAEANVPEPTDS